MSEPIFIFSIDLELAWDFVLNPDHKGLGLLYQDPTQAREPIDSLLEMLKEYHIPATWAVVGGLFLDSDGSKEVIHRDMAQFSEGWLDWEFYLTTHNSPLCCGIDIIDKILASPVEQEVGLHSLFHLPFSRCSYEVAKAEVEVGVKAARRFGISPKSFVFPYNKIKHVDVLKENGFRVYRSRTPREWDDNQRLLGNLFNTGLSRLTAPPARPINIAGIWQLPGSLFFCDRQLPFLLLPRASRGLSRAILESKVFHIWLHERDLLAYKRLTSDMRKFLSLVARKRDAGKLKVMTMGEMAAYLEQKGMKSQL